VKLPKRIADILKKKQEFIDAQRSRLESTVVKLQSKLFSDIVADLIPRLDIKDGNIQETANNYRLLSTLDKTYRDFQQEANTIVLDQLVKGTSKIASLSEKYFSIVLTGNLPARFEKVVNTTNKLINLRLGLDGGKLVNGGFLKSFFESNTIGTELKDMVSKAVTSGMDMKEFTKMLRDKINGVDTKAGMMERQFQRYAYDLYQQYDAAYNATIGNEFGFSYFIYQGGLILDSRDFCAAHNGKVWSVEESKDWATWTPAQGEYPEGYEVKAKDLYAVPSYLGYPGYDALIDRGGYNCRHALGWIPDDMAFDMRPELKNLT
jgi:hypothetical protein